MKQLVRWAGLALVVVGALALRITIPWSPATPESPSGRLPAEFVRQRELREVPVVREVPELHRVPEPPEVPSAPEPPARLTLPELPSPPARPVPPEPPAARVIDARALAAAALILVGAYLIWGKRGQVAAGKEPLAR